MSALLLLLSLLFLAPPAIASGDGVPIAVADYQGLLAVKNELADPRGVLRGWNGNGNGSGACSGEWVGIICAKGRVIEIQLPRRGLAGLLSDRIGQLSALRRLSVHDNGIAGPIPESIGFLSDLRGLYLFNNRFSGAIPAAIGACAALQSVDLSNNRLTGELPAGIANSTNLIRLNVSRNGISGGVPATIATSPSLVFLSLGYNELAGPMPASWRSPRLEFLDVGHNRLTGGLPESIAAMPTLRGINLGDNEFTGAIPTELGSLPRLESFDVPNNNLSGEVPPALAKKFSASSFKGNLELCGYSPSAPCLSPAPAPSPLQAVSGRPRLSFKAFIFIICGIAAGLLLLCVALLYCLIARRRQRPSGESENAEKSKTVESSDKPGDGGEEKETEQREPAGGKLVHFDGPTAFTADDLLCATAEIMGKSTYGTVYKATLDVPGAGEQLVAVKRLREKNTKGNKEFEAEVAGVGHLRHRNLLPLRAYYVGPKGEKLLVFDYMPNGSLSFFLHARSPEAPAVAWPARMVIAKGTARGLSYLHDEVSTVHGNLTSSNVLIDVDGTPKIADFGLSRLMTAAANSNVLAAAGALGYRAPELSKIKKASTKTDVYSLGVIILELLTGKPAPPTPGAASGSTGSGMYLPEWVASAVREEWTNEVFDPELLRDPGGGDELLNTLKLAMHCVDPSPANRPEAKEVLQQLEEIHPASAAAAGDGGQ